MTSAMSAAARLKSPRRAAFWAAFSLISSSCVRLPSTFRFFGSFFSSAFPIGRGRIGNFSGSCATTVPGTGTSAPTMAGASGGGGGGIAGSLAPPGPGVVRVAGMTGGTVCDSGVSANFGAGSEVLTAGRIETGGGVIFGAGAGCQVFAGSTALSFI